VVPVFAKRLKRTQAGLEATVETCIETPPILADGFRDLTQVL
jgi:hypothetical protein